MDHPPLFPVVMFWWTIAANVILFIAWLLSDPKDDR